MASRDGAYQNTNDRPLSVRKETVGQLQNLPENGSSGASGPSGGVVVVERGGDPKSSVNGRIVIKGVGRPTHRVPIHPATGARVGTKPGGEPKDLFDQPSNAGPTTTTDSK